MTKKVISVKADDSLKKVFKLMDEHGILGVPVVDDEEAVVGIVTESDLIQHFTTLDKPLSINVLGSLVLMGNTGEFNKDLKEHCAETVGEMMSKDVVTVMENFTLGQCIDLMTEEEVSRLPVVDEVGKLTGIITRTDVVHQLARLKTP